jgi:hypothetical protein
MLGREISGNIESTFPKILEKENGGKGKPGKKNGAR